MLNVLHKSEDTRDKTDISPALPKCFREVTYETGNLNRPVGYLPAHSRSPLTRDRLLTLIPPEYPGSAMGLAADNSASVTLYAEPQSPWAKYVRAKESIAGLLTMTSLVFPKTDSTTHIGQLAHELVLCTDCLTESDPLAGYEAYAVADWDGYDARPITPDTLRAARSILKSLPNCFGAPVCSPGADGSIVFEWLRDDGPLRKLFIDIGPGRTWKAYWRLASGETGTIPRKSVTIGTISDIQKLFEILLRG